MAYLVLEEDGVSRIRLEEASEEFSSLITEESVVDPLAKSGAGVAGTVSDSSSTGGTPVPAAFVKTGAGIVGTIGSGRVARVFEPVAQHWKAGGFAFPTSTGNLAVTGVGFQPQGVLFIYSNQSTEDAVVTGTNLGAGIGMASVDWDSAAVVQYAICQLPNQGSEYRPSCIVMETNGTTTDYRADMVSFDADGFTINVTNAASAARPVHWLAWGEFDHAGAHKMLAGSQVLALGWQAKALLCLGNRTASGNNRTTSATGWNWLNMGGARYPTSSSLWKGAWITTIAAPSGQKFNDVDTWAINPIRVGQMGHATGPFLVMAFNLARPSGTGNTSLSLDSALEDFNMFAFWDGDADDGLFTPASAVDGTQHVTFENPVMNGQPAAVITLGISNQAQGGAPDGANVACQFGFATKDYQACVIVDADGSFYQSGQRSFVSAINPGGVNAGTIQFVSGGFNAVTDTAALPGSAMAYLAFGPPEQLLAWIPQTYRRL